MPSPGGLPFQLPAPFPLETSDSGLRDPQDFLSHLYSDSQCQVPRGLLCDRLNLNFSLYPRNSYKVVLSRQVEGLQRDSCAAIRAEVWRLPGETASDSAVNKSLLTSRTGKPLAAHLCERLPQPAAGRGRGGLQHRGYPDSPARVHWSQKSGMSVPSSQGS